MQKYIKKTNLIHYFKKNSTFAVFIEKRLEFWIG